MSINSAKKSRGRPKVDSEAINTRFERRYLDAIDAFAAKHEPPLTRPDVIRVLTAEGLMREGLIPPLADQIQELWLAYKKRQEDLGKTVPSAKALPIEIGSTEPLSERLQRVADALKDRREKVGGTTDGRTKRTVK